jgi:phage terminase large subunit-like protein
VEKDTGRGAPASFIQHLARSKKLDALLDTLSEADARLLLNEWDYWVQDAQRAPGGAWRVWLLMAGRGFGKTRIGAEWVRRQAALHGTARIALVGATMAEARAVMVEGESGLLTISRGQPDEPRWEPSLNRLRWPSGACAALYSAAEPDGLRGPQHSHAWADEIGKWGLDMAAWDNLQFGLRLGLFPRVVASTTPKPVPLLKRLIGEAGVIVTRGRSRDNRAHVSAQFMAAVTDLYGGTRLGRQELDGELIEELAEPMWPRDLIEACRAELPERQALGPVVIGVDPPAGRTGNACGIVAVAKGPCGRGYVLADHSVAGAGPEGWAAAVAGAAAAHGAALVVAEANQGGAMVESVLRACDRALPLRLVHAKVGKGARAGPVAALFRSGKALLGGRFPELEDELAGFSLSESWTGAGSPDRADAMVWALTEPMLGRRGEPSIRVL